MSTLQKSHWINPEDYLEGEKISELKHEYVAGYVHAMTGASDAHNLIAGNLYIMLRSHLQRKSKPCQVFISDMKVRTDNAFYYPDIVVTCNPDDNERYYKSSPSLIIEVLSPTTERADALEKRIAYQTLTSLQEYVLVAQDKQEVHVYRRNNSEWDLETFLAGDQVRFVSVDLQIAIGQIYQDVDSSS